MSENVYLMKLIETFDLKPILKINVQFCCIKKLSKRKNSYMLHSDFK